MTRSLGITIYEILSNLTWSIGTRVYPGITPDSATVPYATYRIVSEGATNSINNGPGTLCEGAIQIDIWSTTAAARGSNFETLYDEINGLTGNWTAQNGCVVRKLHIENAFDNEETFEKSGAETIYYRKVVNAIIWFLKNAPSAT